MLGSTSVKIYKSETEHSVTVRHETECDLFSATRGRIRGNSLYIQEKRHKEGHLQEMPPQHNYLPKYGMGGYCTIPCVGVVSQ